MPMSMENYLFRVVSYLNIYRKAILYVCFLYVDGGRVLATARHPYLELGMTGRLRVTSIDCGTVYLDLGIPKELVVPVSEQRGSFEVGRMALVYVALDDQGRLFGTQRFNRYIKDFADSGEYKPGQRSVPCSGVAYSAWF